MMVITTIGTSPPALIEDYLLAIKPSQVDVV
jgi:hypothetical protein